MAISMKSTRRAVLVACAIAAGCVSVLPEPKAPEAIYTISAPASEGDAALVGTVIVHEPTGPRLVAGRQILFEQADGAFVLLAGREWTDNATVMMQYALVDTLNGGAGPGVALTDGSGARGNVEVSWRLQYFALREGEAQAAISVTLLSVPRREALWQRRYDARVPVVGESEVPALAAAAREVIAQAAADVRSEMTRREAEGLNAPGASGRRGQSPAQN